MKGNMMSNREVYWNLSYEDKRYRIVADNISTARIERQLSGIGYAEAGCSPGKRGMIRLEVVGRQGLVGREQDRELGPVL